MIEMKLRNEYFNYIKNGTKRIEMRLNDEKRQKIKIGDIIKFVNEDTLEELKTKVVNKYIFNSFKELVNNFNNDILADNKIDKEELIQLLNNIYSKEKQEKYQVVAIQIELI